MRNQVSNVNRSSDPATVTFCTDVHVHLHFTSTSAIVPLGEVRQVYKRYNSQRTIGNQAGIFEDLCEDLCEAAAYQAKCKKMQIVHRLKTV